SRADADLTAKIYDRVPVLVNEAKGLDGNPWGFSYATKLFDMADDSGLFRNAVQLRAAGFERDGVDWVPGGLATSQKSFDLAGGRDARSLDLQGGSSRRADRYVPLYEAKMIHQFDHRWATYDASGETSRDVTLVEKADPDFEPAPRYWVRETEVAARLAAKGWTRGWLMGWRDIASATDERTVIAAAVPRAGVGNNLPLLFADAKYEAMQTACLLACLSSLSLDFVA